MSLNYTKIVVIGKISEIDDYQCFSCQRSTYSASNLSSPSKAEKF